MAKRSEFSYFEAEASASFAFQGPTEQGETDFCRKSYRANLHRRFMQSNEYVKLAEVEDHMWYFHSLHAHVHRELLRSVAPTEAAEILDAGCGTGGLIQRLRGWEPRWRFSGIDYSALACEFAAKRCAVPIAEASVTALPFPPASFDAIVSADVICQIDNPQIALAEFYRCLRPGGTVVINVPAYMWMWSYHDVVCETKHRYVRGELVEMLTQAGFAVYSSTYWNTLLFPLLALRRKLLTGLRNTSDVQSYPAPVEAICRTAMSVEHASIGMFGSFPFGSSVLAMARRPAI